MSVKKIVITGGPCAGKTTCLGTLEERLSEKGYKVLTISEAATEMMQSGIQIPDVGSIPFENMLIEFQIAKEKLAEQAAAYYPKTVMLIDRGIPDCQAYLGKDEYEKALEHNHLGENEALNRYDAVFHLVTAANGAEQFYTCANNTARTETIEQARLLDEKTQHSYVGHPHLRVIDNSTDFQTKINRLCGEVFSVLGVPVPLEVERKFLIQRPSDEFLKGQGAVVQKIAQTYLKSHGDKERRIRERGDSSGFTCFYTEKQTLSPMKRIERERKISTREYMQLMTEAEAVLTKMRWCFVHEGQYFELDTFDQEKDFALLEIEVNDENQKITLPPWCRIVREVTGEVAYQNHEIAQNGFPKGPHPSNERNLSHNQLEKE